MNPSQGRAKPTARARGKPTQQQTGLPPHRPGPPSLQSAAPPPIPKPRARGSIVAAPGSSQAAPRPPVQEVTQRLQAAKISGAGDEASRGGGDKSRGNCRQRPVELVTRPTNMETKQGSFGHSINLQANFFNFASFADWTLYQYRVDFQPDEETTFLRKAFLRPHQQVLGPYLFDGTVLFTITRLPDDPTEFCTTRQNDQQPVRVIIKRTTDCVKGDYQYLQVLNIILRKTIAALNLQLVGRDYYDAQGKVVLKQHNLEVWPGYVTSIRQHEREILLNVDVSSKVMRNETAFNLLRDCRERSPNNWKELFEAAIIGTTVITRYNNATYRVDDVDYDSTPLTTFDMKGNQVSFTDYYRTKYNLNITSKDQPLLVSKPKARDIRGGRSGNIVLVPELCCLTGITDSMRSNFQLMRALADHTRIRPSARIDRLENGFMKRIYSTPAAAEELQLWNMKINPHLIQFPGRQLPAEVIAHGDGKKSEADQQADFTKKLRGTSMLDSAKLTNWVCIYPSRVSRDIESFCATLARAADSLRFRIPEPQWEEIADDRCGTYVDAIERVINRHNPMLIMCILLTNKADRYEAIKKKCYVDRAMPNQVVLAKNLSSKGVMSICTKIAIQINCKLGGSPWSCPVPFKTPVMVVGFDVTHDTRQKGRSVGALVASLNMEFSRYFSAVSMHVNGEELSNDIAVQMLKAVTKFRSINNEVPSKIIFYRDGVGDGNIHYVLSHEVELIKKTLDEFYPGGGVNMTVVIVSKKINARIFNNADNAPPGTVVDDVITIPERYDFYLVSQSVNQGTVSPTYYNVIYDTVRLKPDLLQRLTYKMTHLYYNWSGTVRVPAPCQYAHKLAFLVGQSIHRAPNPLLEDLLYFL